MKYVVGLTGGIGSGKSAAANQFFSLGASIVDADQIARDLVNTKSPALELIAQHFGNHLLLPNGSLDRKTLREIIFKDSHQKKWLENLLHPLIRHEIILQLTNAKGPYAILVSPLLLETDQYQLVDRVLVIDAEQNLQIKRATERDNCSPEQIKAIIATQMGRSERLSHVQDVIHNHGDLDELHKQVKILHEKYLTLSNSQSTL